MQIQEAFGLTLCKGRINDRPFLFLVQELLAPNVICVVVSSLP